MSLLDQVKGWLGKGKQAAQEHQPQVSDAIDKAGKVVDDKTGGKHYGQDREGAGRGRRRRSAGSDPGLFEWRTGTTPVTRHHACDPPQ